MVKVIYKILQGEWNVPKHLLLKQRLNQIIRP